MTRVSPESYASKLAEPQTQRPLPLDGSTLTMRIPVDYTSLDQLVAAMMAAIMLESPHMTTRIIDADPDL